MPRLRRLSGNEVIAILGRFGFRVHSQRGNHVKLRRLAAGGTTQTLTIPQHRQLDRGTLRAIIRQASRFVSAEELGEEFYVE